MCVDYKVCDEPHPLLIKEMLTHCVDGKLDEAYRILKSLWDKGYSSHDIITNIFRVCKTHQMPEFLKLEYIKVCMSVHVLKPSTVPYTYCTLQEIGFTHMKIAEGVETLLQFSGLLARLCLKITPPK